MENKSTPNKDFENYLRKSLEQIEASPDDDLWAQIADKQAQPNKRLRFRRYGMYAAGAVLFITAVVGLWSRQKSTRNAVGTNTGQAQQVQAPDPLAPITAPPPADGQDVSANHTDPKKQVFAPNFSPRVNSVPASAIRFRTESGLHYQSPVTGTSVHIPANSLVDQNGVQVHGEAEFFFREYRTISEFLAAGIPMHYTDARGAFFFNSGGMFEVRVAQAGTPLKMAAGQAYDVAFSPTEHLENASLYYLDDRTKTWKFRPDAAFGQQDLNEPPVVAESTVVSNNTGGQTLVCRPEPGELAGDPNPVDFVKIGVQTGFDLATGKITMPTWFKRNPALTDDQLLFRLERGLIQIKKHRDQSQLFFPEDLNKFFTELAAFKDCYFTYNMDSLGGNRNARNLTAGDYWQRITVAQENGANCIITLYDGKDGQMQFHAVLSGSTENKHFNPEKVMAEYEQLRHQRQLDFARKNQALRYFLYASWAFRPKEEWCFNLVEWLDYFEKNHALMARRYADLIKEGLATDDLPALNAWKKWQATMRNQKFDTFENLNPTLQSKNNLGYALRLSDFGTYNCDQIFRLGNGQGIEYVNTGYKTTDGKRIIAAFVSIMERRTKTFFTLPSAATLVCTPGRKLDVIVTDRNGRQYYFPADKYATQKFDKTGVTVLTLQDVTEQTQSPRAWAELLEI